MREAGRTVRRGGVKKREYGLKRSDNPDVFYGRDFDEEAVTIDTIQGEVGEVVIRGQIIDTDMRELRMEKNDHQDRHYRLYGYYRS